MARKQLNSTAAIVSEPLRMNSEFSISVRRIDNGYLTRKSSCDQDGNYRSSELYSASPPGRDGKGKSAVGKDSLALTKAYLEQK